MKRSRQKWVFWTAYVATFIGLLIIIEGFLFILQRLTGFAGGGVIAGLFSVFLILLPYPIARHFCRRMGLSIDERIRERLTIPQMDMSVPDFNFPLQNKRKARFDKNSVHLPNNSMQNGGQTQTVLWVDIASCEISAVRNVVGDWGMLTVHFFNLREEKVMEIRMGSAHSPLFIVLNAEAIMNQLRMRFAEREILHIERHESKIVVSLPPAVLTKADSNDNRTQTLRQR